MNLQEGRHFAATLGVQAREMFTGKALWQKGCVRNHALIVAASAKSASSNRKFPAFVA